ncbi:ABC-type transporter, integral membrane subunit [Microbacterium laevaniformans OR221]|jgi:multiple sugar transport system permease protein|nr:ABC-type transporter, integral membrane subunit [Microbacterium laevaniformans OR221]
MTLKTPVSMDTEVLVTGVAHSRRRRQLRRTTESYGFLAPTLILLLVLMIVPIIMVIGYSLQSNAILSKHSEFVGLENYLAVLGDATFWKATSNTVVFTVVSVAAHLVLGLGFALMLNSPLIGGFSRAVFRGLYVLPWLFTVAVIAVLWRMLLAPNGVINFLLQSQIEWLASPQLALGTVTFINIWAGYPFFMVSLLAGLQGIPSDLYEAATVDGASSVQRFWNVTLPQLRPIIVSLLLLDLIWTSQQFALIWMATGGGPIDVTEVLSTYTYKLAFATYDFSLAATAAVLVLLMSMVLAVFYVRHQKARD